MSEDAPEIPVEVQSPEARLGSAVHACLHRLLNGQEVDPAQAAEQWGVEAAQLEPLFFMGRQLWGQYADLLRILYVEEPLWADVEPGLELHGTADIIAHADKEPGDPLVIWDWKSGSSSADYWPQLYGYAFLALKSFPEATAVRVAVAWIRDRLVDIREIGLADLDDWLGRLDESLRGREAGQYAPSPETCQFCRRRYECSGRQQLVRSSIGDVIAWEQ
jgi:hypothetical protein